MSLSALNCFLGTVLIILIAINVQGKEVPVHVYSYRETVGDLSTSFYWQVEVKVQQIFVSVYEQDASFIDLCTTDGATWQWQLKDRVNPFFNESEMEKYCS